MKYHMFFLLFSLLFASQIFHMDLEEILPGADTVLEVTVLKKIEAPNSDRIYSCLVREVLKGKCPRTNIVLKFVPFTGFYDEENDIMESPLVEYSGLEYDLKRGTNYIVLFYGFNTNAVTNHLLRAEKAAQKNKVKKLLNR